MKVVFLCLAIAFAALVRVEAKRCPILHASGKSEKSGCYIVVLKEATTHEKFQEIVQRAVSVADDAKVHSAVEKVIKAFTVKLSPYSLEVLRRVPEVDYIEEETMATGSQTTTLPWHLDRLDQVRLPLDGRYQPMGNGSGVDIYVLDSGVNFDHNEFGGRAIYSGYDPIDNYYTDVPRQNGRDCYGHGSHVASLAAGRAYGVAKGARIYSVRVLNCDNFGPWSVTLDGIDHTATVIAQRNRPAVVSMSLGGDYTQSVNNAVERLISQGIPVVVSAGNSFDDACLLTPASAPNVIAVAGSASNDGIYFTTSYGSCVHIFAPGSSITGADHRCTSCSKILSGTSMSTPMVSGVLAMYLQKNPRLNPRELRNKLITEATVDALNFGDIPSSYRDITPNRLLFAGSGSESPTTPSVTTPTTLVTPPDGSRPPETPTCSPVPVSCPSPPPGDQPTCSPDTVGVNPGASVNSVLPTILRETLEDAKTSLYDLVDSALNDLLQKKLHGLVSEYPAKSCQEIGEISTVNVSDYYWVRNSNGTVSKVYCDFSLKTNIQNDIGVLPSSAARSCQEIAEIGFQSTSGYYWIKNSNNSVFEVYCDLSSEFEIKSGLPTSNPGWMRIASVDATDPTQTCPGDLQLITSPKRCCGRSNSLAGCSSAIFQTHGISYRKVCGRIIGYQNSTPNAFYHYQYYTDRSRVITIDDTYVDGVSLTYGAPRRNHIWTFAATIDETQQDRFVCPCTHSDTTLPVTAVPSFIGNDYFCDTGSRGVFQAGRFYDTDPLWDGEGCGPTSTCCQFNNPPWFCKELPMATTDDVELRLCANENRDNEDTPIELVELYIQ